MLKAFCLGCGTFLVDEKKLIGRGGKRPPGA
jgi:hypothetical protein